MMVKLSRTAIEHVVKLNEQVERGRWRAKIQKATVSFHGTSS